MATRKKRRSSSPAQQEAWVKKWEASGLPQSRFAREHGLNVKNLNYWVGNVRGKLPPSRRKGGMGRPPAELTDADVAAFAEAFERGGPKAAADVAGITGKGAEARRRSLIRQGRWPGAVEPDEAGGKARTGRAPGRRLTDAEVAAFVGLVELHGIKAAAEETGISVAAAYQRVASFKKQGRWNSRGSASAGKQNGAAIVVAQKAATPKKALELDFGDGDQSLEPAFPQPDGDDRWDELIHLLRPLPPRSKIRVLTLVERLVSG